MIVKSMVDYNTDPNNNSQNNSFINQAQSQGQAINQGATAKTKKQKENFIVKILTYYFILIKTRDFAIVFSLVMISLITFLFQSSIINLLKNLIKNPYYDSGLFYIILGIELGFLVAAATISVFTLPNMTRILKEELNKLHGTPYVRLAKLLIGKRRFFKLVKFMQKITRNYVIVTGEFDNSEFFIIKHEAYAIDSIPIVVISLAIANYIMLYSPLSIYFSPIINLVVNIGIIIYPILEFMYPYFYYSSKCSDMLNYFPYEFPFFLVVSAIASSSGLPLSYVYEKLSKNPVMRAFRQEAKAVVRDLRSFGMSLTEVIGRRASVHKNRDYSTFLYGYTALVSSGGDVNLYLSDKAKAYINELSLRWKLYAEKVTTMGETIILIFLLIPMLLAIVSVVGGGANALVILIFLPPIFTILLYNSVKTIKPKTMNTVKYKPIYGLVGAFATGAFLLFLSNVLQPYMIFGIASIVGLLIIYLQVRNKVIELKQVENSLPDFLRQITEFRKIGFDLNKSVVRSYETFRYPKYFSSFLSNIVKQVKTGVPMNQLRVRTNSWLTRLVFYIFGLLMEGGNIPSSVLEDLTIFVSDYSFAKRDALSRTRPYLFLGVIIPVVIAGGLLFALAVLSSFTSLSSIASIAQVPVFQAQVSPTVLQFVYIFLIESAVGIGLVMNKINGETIMDTPLPIFSIVLTMFIIQFSSIILPAISSAI